MTTRVNFIELTMCIAALLFAAIPVTGMVSIMLWDYELQKCKAEAFKSGAPVEKIREVCER